MPPPKPYEPPVDQLLALGDPRPEGPGRGMPRTWRDYRTLGLTESHIDELIRLVTDKRFLNMPGDRPGVWGGLHAWRALGQLQAAAAVEPLLSMLDAFEQQADDWGLEEVPVVLGMIGPAAVQPTAAYMNDATHGLYARVAATVALREIAQRHPECRAECIELLSECLMRGRWHDGALNAFLVSQLVNLRAEESAPVVARAFAQGQVDVGIVGRWEKVRKQLVGEGT